MMKTPNKQILEAALLMLNRLSILSLDLDNELLLFFKTGLNAIIQADAGREVQHIVSRMKIQYDPNRIYEAKTIIRIVQDFGEKYEAIDGKNQSFGISKVEYLILRGGNFSGLKEVEMTHDNIYQFPAYSISLPEKQRI